MGLTMSQRQAVTKAIAARYRRADKAGKGRILDELQLSGGRAETYAIRGITQAEIDAYLGVTRAVGGPTTAQPAITAVSSTAPTATAAPCPARPTS
jgi:hypothetical protein